MNSDQIYFRFTVTTPVQPSSLNFVQVLEYKKTRSISYIYPEHPLPTCPLLLSVQSYIEPRQAASTLHTQCDIDQS